MRCVQLRLPDPRWAGPVRTGVSEKFRCHATLYGLCAEVGGVAHVLAFLKSETLDKLGQLRVSSLNAPNVSVVANFQPFPMPFNQTSSEAHTSELTSLIRTSYADFSLITKLHP